MARNTDKRRARSAYVNGVIGENIRAHRQRLGLTQRDLAELLSGSDESYFRSVENGHKHISLIRLVEIADVLGVNARDLLDGV